MFDFRKAFAFFFEDLEWLPKLLIGTVLMFAAGLLYTALHLGFTIGMMYALKDVGSSAPGSIDEDLVVFGISTVGQLLGALGYGFVVCVVWGYGKRLFENVVRGNELPLPRWEQWRALFIEGAKALGIAFVYALPLLIPMALATGWFFYESATSRYSPDLDDLLESGGGLAACCTAVGWGLYLMLIPGPLMQYAGTGQARNAFRLGAVLRGMRAASSAYWLAVVASTIALIIGVLGLSLLCVGVNATLFFAQIVGVHAFAQVYRIGHTPGT